MIVNQRKYIALVSPRLDQFRSRGSATTYNFRCPLCRDSQRNRRKARGYFYEKENRYFFHCHNCNKSWPFEKFLKEFDHILYSQYLMEEFENSDHPTPPSSIFKSTTDFYDYPDLFQLSELPSSHSAVRYVLRRKVPRAFLDQLFYVDAFKAFTNYHVPNKFESLEHDEGRLIIPFIDQNKNVFGFQGRSLQHDATLRYITIMMDEEKPKLYGLDRVDFNRTFYVLEGPFDSMFVENSIATCGGDLLSDVRAMHVEHKRAVIVYDNQPRNKQVVNNIRKAINADFSVVIWPETFQEKDVNDQILNRKTTSEQIMSLLAENSFSGLEALLKFEQWKKC